MASDTPERPETFNLSGIVDDVIRQKPPDQVHRMRHGAVKAPVTLEWLGKRMIAVGKTLHVVDAENAKVFLDILTPYLAHCLWSKEDWEAEKTKSLQLQHPAMQWQTHWANEMERAAVGGGDMPNALGACHAWFRLAYDLYLVEHNAELQARLIQRLRQPDGFQGARFEAAVAAMMLAAGYELAFIDDNDGLPGRRPEFIATHCDNGHRLAVEAKSRHRTGIMQSRQGAAIRRPDRAGLDSLIGSALAKNPECPLLIFVEANLPDTHSEAKEFITEIQASWDAARTAVPPQEFPAIGIVVYNDVSPWMPTTEVPNDGFIWALGLYSENRHNLDARSLFHQIMTGVMQRTRLPEEFPKS